MISRTAIVRNRDCTIACWPSAVAALIRNQPRKPMMGGLLLVVPGNAVSKDCVVRAFPRAMSVPAGDSLGRDGCSRLFSLVSDLLRG